MLIKKEESLKSYLNKDCSNLYTNIEYKTLSLLTKHELIQRYFYRINSAANIISGLFIMLLFSFIFNLILLVGLLP